MNPREKQAAAKLVNIVHGAEIVCPMCLAESGLQPVHNSYQLQCDSCKTRITFYVQESERKKEAQIPTAPPTNSATPARKPQIPAGKKKKLIPFLSEIENRVRRRK